MDSELVLTRSERLAMAMKKLEDEIRLIQTEQEQEVQELKSRLEDKITSLSKGKSVAEEIGIDILRDALRHTEQAEKSNEGSMSFYSRKIGECAQVIDRSISSSERRLQNLKEIVETEIEKAINVLQTYELKEKKKKKDKDKKKKKSKKD